DDELGQGDRQGFAFLLACRKNDQTQLHVMTSLPRGQINARGLRPGLASLHFPRCWVETPKEVEKPDSGPPRPRVRGSAVGKAGPASRPWFVEKGLGLHAAKLNPGSPERERRSGAVRAIEYCLRPALHLERGTGSLYWSLDVGRLLRLPVAESCNWETVGNCTPRGNVDATEKRKARQSFSWRPRGIYGRLWSASRTRGGTRAVLGDPGGLPR